jgi:hypothetical protein
VAFVVLAGLGSTAGLALNVVPVGAAPVVGIGGDPQWTSATAPFPFGSGTSPSIFIEASDCPMPTFCVMVGHYATAVAEGVPMAETYSGGEWIPATLPVPSGAATGTLENAGLTAVSCFGPDSCVAVGTYMDTRGHFHGLIESLSGPGWTATAAPEPAGSGAGAAQSSSLFSVSCPASGYCSAIGRYEDGTFDYLAMVADLSGGAWSAEAAPAPANAGAGPTRKTWLTSVACQGALSCTAVGGYVASTGGTYGLIDTTAGGSWAPVQAPAPGNAEHAPGLSTWTLTSVSCPAATSCVAVGSYADTLGGKSSVAETSSGGSWSAVAVPTPSNFGSGPGTTSSLDSVSCPVAGSCAAGGTYTSVTTSQEGLLETLTGGHWSGVEAPLPSSPAPVTDQSRTSTRFGIRSVSCSAPGSCEAVGKYLTDLTVTDGFIESLAGGSWTTVAAPQPASTTPADAALTTVSCASGTCAAGGYHDVYRGLLETTAPSPSGYYEVAADGGVFAFTAPYLGSMGGMPLNRAIVTAASDSVTGGYYEVASDGGVFAFTAPFYGSMGGKPLNAPIVGMAFDPATGGYWEVASDGGIFAFTAPFYGSMGGRPLNAPIVGMAFDPATGGYYEVASDGGIFAFDAQFRGSMGGHHLNAPIVGIAADPLTGGYYEVADDGGLFAFDAPFEGSMGGRPLDSPVTGISIDEGTGGYREVAKDGGLFSFGAPFSGSMGGRPLQAPIVALTGGPIPRG